MQFIKTSGILSNDLKDYQKAVDAAIKKYGKKNSDGYYIDPNDSESIEKFTQEITPISNAKIDVNLFQISKMILSCHIVKQQHQINMLLLKIF